MSNLQGQHGHLMGLRSVVTAVALSVVVTATSASLPAQVTSLKGTTKPASLTDFSFKRVERCVMRKVNKIRRRQGLRTLHRDPQLGYVSRLHAITMADSGSVFHDDNFGNLVTNWSRLGQNTGRGRSCRSVVRAFMNDAVHKAIILGPWRYQGVGIYRSGGKNYVQHIFESRADPGNIYHIP